jgi:hypothetical protein
MDDPADHAPVVLPLDTAHIRRQMRFYPFPLLIAQPKQVLAHDPDPQTNQTVWNQDCLPAAAKLMSSGPNSSHRSLVEVETAS